VFFSLASLRKAKNLPSAGAVDAAVHASARTQLLSALPDAVFGFAQSLIYKPVAASAAAVVFLAGGWMTTSAAQSSLPGDTLYNVKLIAERAQLQVASLDRRAVLHTEFAGRRLEEVAALQRVVTQEPARAQYISETVTAYQEEIASATSDLQTLQTKNQEQALTTAASVLEQVAVLNDSASAIVGTSSSSQNFGEEGQETTEENVAVQVAETTEAIENVATGVAINAHEAFPSEESRHEMESLFRSLLGSIEARRAMILHRIGNIEELSLAQKEILAQAGVTLPKKTEFKKMEEIVEDMEYELPTIMDNFAAGGYRSAIESLQEMDEALLGIESTLTQIEESITGALTQASEQESTNEGEVNMQMVQESETGTGQSAQ
jgi:hypothetical protein